MNSELQKIISEECMNLGLNTAHDYDGIETEEDLIIYTKAIIKKYKELINEQPDLESLLMEKWEYFTCKGMHVQGANIMQAINTLSRLRIKADKRPIECGVKDELSCTYPDCKCQ